jgi:tRNA threonylcarbamoyladenosine biosynthesis protein TsaB
VAQVISLVLEASTYAGSVAVLDGSRLLVERSVVMRGKEHEALMGAVGDILANCAITRQQIDRVICGAGPGSFTSLRIAGAIAKGISAASGAPLVPVSSLALMIGALASRTAGRYLAVLDAMRGDSYVQEFDVDAADRIVAVGAQIVVVTTALDDFGLERRARVVGPARSGAERAEPHARGAAWVTNLIEGHSPANLAGWEPLYGRLAEAQVKWEADNGRPLEIV